MIINVTHIDFLHFEIFDVLQQKKTKKNFYSQQIKNFFLGITLFDTFSLLFQKEKNLMPLFLIACNRGLKIVVRKYFLIYIFAWLTIFKIRKRNENNIF